MSLFIHGIGTSVPQHAIVQGDAYSIARTFCQMSPGQQRLLTRVYQRSGVRSRHSTLLDSGQAGVVDRQSFYPPTNGDDDAGPTTAQRMEVYERDASELAIQAATSALRHAAISPAQVTHLIVVSCTGFYSPGVDVALVRALELPPHVARTHVGYMGCHGALNGLRVAKAFAEADSSACVLLCAVELCSLHYQYGWKPDQIIANAIFADGAAALVASGVPRDHHVWNFRESVSTVVPDTEDMMTWNIRDHGFEMTLSNQVPVLIRQELAPLLEGWLGRFGLSTERIGCWAIHPGGPRIVAACGEALRLNEDQLSASNQVLAEFGNMSSPTILFILDRLNRQAASAPCVALAFGPGLTIEVALLD